MIKMNILVLNSGSSSLKFQIINPDNDFVAAKGMIDSIGLSKSHLIYDSKDKHIKEPLDIKDHDFAVKLIFELLKKDGLLDSVKAIGHRIVHGGEFYSKPVIIDDSVIYNIQKLYPLAPLHNPAHILGILACKTAMPDLKQVAVFDTSFHQTIKKESYMYAIPYEYYEKYGLRKYGFHGTSHEYVMLEAIKLLKDKNAKIITCHLGNGSSVCAIKDQKSVEISMGLTPLKGLIMGTRSGDIDPEIISFLCEKENITPKQAINILNKHSGLKGICNDSDVRTMRELSDKSPNHKLAIDMFCHRVLLYIGSYNALLNGADALVFTAGIGQNAWYIRKQICDSMTNLGFEIDDDKNKKNEIEISSKNSKVRIFVIPTNEELMIAKETMNLLN